MKNDDAELIQRTLEGDQHAFAQLVEKYQEQVHTLAWQKIGDYHIAQEITQDVFITAYQKFPTFTHYRQFAGWLYVVTNRKCIAWHRKKKIETQSIDETNPTELDEVYYSEYMSQQREEAAKEERRTIVQKLLSKLQESDRTVMHLYYIAEMSCEEIAEFLGVAPNTVRSRLHRARNRLKKEEAVIKENLSSFQLPTQMTENIMQEISRLNPVAPSGSKPLVPLAVSAAAAVLVLLLMGSGTQYLNRFQKPYSLNAQSEPTIEIVDTQIVFESPTEPTVKNKVGNTDITNDSNSAGQNSDTALTDATQEKNGISDKKGQWSKTNGPVGGRVVNLYATVDGDVFAGTQSGIYKLTDDGAAWNRIYLRDIFSHRKQMSGMRSGPMVEKDGVLYLATDRKILRSKDRGKTWKTLSVHPGGGLIDMVILDQTFYLCLIDEFYLSGDNGVYRSDDNGASWVRLTPFDNKYPNIEPRAIAVIDDTVYVGTNKGLYRLNGNTWEQIFLDEIGEKSTYLPIISMEVKDNFLYVARSYRIENSFRVFLDGKGRKPVHLITNDSYVELKETPLSLHRAIGLAQEATDLSWALFQSTDHGKTWKNITPRKDNTDKNVTSPDKKDMKKKDTKSSHNSRLYTPLKIAVTGKKLMLIDHDKHFFSINSGETWRTLENTENLGSAYAMVSLNEDTYYRSGNYGIHRTTDGGKSWHQFNTGLVNTDVWQLIAVDGTLYANSVNGFVHSIDGGESWTPVNGDTGFITRIMESNGDIFVRDDKLGAPRFFRLSTQDNSLINISEIPVLDKVDPYKENPQLNRPTGFMRRNVSHGDGSFFESQLGGIAVVNGTYYVEYGYQLYRWKPGNTQWLNTGLLDKGISEDWSYCYANNIFIDAIGFRFAVSGNIIYVGEKEGQLLRSLDEGLTWTDVTGNLPFPIDHYKAIALAGNFVYVATDKGVVMSANGTDWYILTGAKGKPLIVTMFAVEGTTVYGEARRKIYQVNNGMTTWEQVTPKIPPSIAHTITCFDVDGDTLYVGTRKRGVLRFSLDDSTDR
ncbi:MAG: sigma-70 family RNA polymerase sigma factor [Candidatus Poribacteria bacterium]|nr:sigma-70 family RNA polymerase sigma factor [Candidatus Poribacteria bacterium]